MIERNMEFDLKPGLMPIFPLKGALLLPNTKLPLNIFEPKYLKMVNDVLKSDQRLIGMIQPLESHEKYSTPIVTSKLYSIGCAGRITSFEELDDGRYVITLSGVNRFRLVELIDKASYLEGQVDWSDFPIDKQKINVEGNNEADNFLNIISDYFSSQNISTDWNVLKSADQETLVNSLSMLCPFENDEKQALLEAYSLFDRKKMLSTLMEISSQKQGNDIMQ